MAALAAAEEAPVRSVTTSSSRPFRYRLKWTKHCAYVEQAGGREGALRRPH